MKRIPQEIRETPIGELTKHPANAKKGDKALIAESIEENGWYGIVIAQKSSGRILVGNHRYDEAVAKGADSLPVAWVDVDDLTAEKIMLVDNRSSDAGGYDLVKLGALLQNVRTGAGDLKGTGYTLGGVQALLEATSRQTEGISKPSEGYKLDGIDSPFPWFGGKARVTKVVWERLGADVANFVEPFFGSGAMLLRRPGDPGVETVNDLDSHICNAWRALKYAPEQTARFATSPVNECELAAKHLALVQAKENLSGKLMADMKYFDEELAGWWLWGIACWIGSGWCSGEGPWGIDNGLLADIGAKGVMHRKRPHLTNVQGVNKSLATAGDPFEPSDSLLEWFSQIAGRLRNVRVCCGDWSRVLGPTVTTGQGMTAVFLDPPYDLDVRNKTLYSTDQANVAKNVLAWCKANGENPLLRICLAGYDGEHNELEEIGWSVFAWDAPGGYGNQGEDTPGRENAKKERLWFSPHCL